MNHLRSPQPPRRFVLSGRGVEAPSHTRKDLGAARVSCGEDASENPTPFGVVTFYRRISRVAPLANFRRYDQPPRSSIRRSLFKQRIHKFFRIERQQISRLLPRSEEH